MTNSIPKPYNTEIESILLFEEQLKLFFGNNMEKEQEEIILDENLGQVFTPGILARFMIQLIEEKITPQSKILDPCIGPNTFFKTFPDYIQNCYLTGIEIDNRLINFSTKKFYNQPKRTLINGSFFGFPNSEKFDVIIQNPPYVRQELLLTGNNAKSKIKNSFFKTPTIPSQSNLYIYFLLKSILHLRENGVLVAVIYDSWLYSSFGNFLKESFLKLGHLESIYHFKKNAFKDVEVGATVLKFVKSINNRKGVKYYSLNDLEDIKKYAGISQKPISIKPNELLAYSFNNASVINTNSNFFIPLKSISSSPIQRGTSAIINNYFIFSQKCHEEAIPIIKDVTSIKTYSVPKKSAFILAINGAISEKTKSYISTIKEKIINTPHDKYKAVKKAINSNNSWYKVKLKESGNFIFNYYLRNNIDFIYNPEKNLSSDNFYSILIPSYEFSYLAILNSSFTRLSVLNSSRSQGNGLRKIQLYKFKEVKIIDINKLSQQTIHQLEILGKALLNLNRYKNEQSKIIAKIDAVLLTAYNEYTNSSLNLETLQKEVKEYGIT